MVSVASTDFLSITDFFKATPAEEGGRRFIYLEASNEGLDQQGEVVLAKALEDSAPYYLRNGNLDLEHLTQIGPQRGIPNYALYEIGQPVDVKVAGRRVMVKGELYQGNTPVAANANIVWDSLTKVSPAQRWFPSVGGAVLEKRQELDPKTSKPRTMIRKVRWTNIGLSRTPVNQHVAAASAVPFGALAKSWTAGGFDIAKALDAAPVGLTAGYGTDSTDLTGGAALREQSLDKHLQSYWDFRQRLAGDVRAKRVAQVPAELVAHATRTYGLGPDEASEWTERFLADLKAGPNPRSKH